jgi:hypothetical protein
LVSFLLCICLNLFSFCARLLFFMICILLLCILSLFFFSLIFCLFVLLAVGVVLCNPTSPLRLSLSLSCFSSSVSVFCQCLSHPVTSINNQGVAILAPAYVDDSISNINIIIKYVDWVA